MPSHRKADDFRRFMAECGENSREAVQVLKAAELLEGSRARTRETYRANRGNRLPIELTYLLICGGIGAILALLFAPKSGEELRGDIAEATRKRIDRSRVRDRAGVYYEATRERAQELYSQADYVSQISSHHETFAKSKPKQLPFLL